MISVIIPAYNAENTIEAALSSVLQQEGNFDFEIIVINDGSTDQTLEIVQQFEKENPNANVIVFEQENRGVSAARNVGLRNAKGDFIAFLDADDVWLPQKTQQQMNLLTDERLNIDFLTTHRNNETAGFPYKIGGNGLIKVSLKTLLTKVIGQTSTAIFKRSVMDDVGLMDEAQRYSEDANYWMKVAHKKQMYLLPVTLVITGNWKNSCGESGLSANLKAMEKGIQKNIDEMHQLGYINAVEYIFFKLFSKLKYFIRLIRVRLR